MKSISIVLALVASTSVASAQITTVGPFTGTDSEEFAQPGPGFNPCVPYRVFNNQADLCTPGNSNASVAGGWGYYCFIGPNTQPYLFGSAGGYAEYSFDFPVKRFGGYFGNNTNTPDGVVEFLDANGVSIGTAPILLPADCVWHWQGWSLGNGPFAKTIRVTGNHLPGAGGFVMMDSMQVDFVASGPVVYCTSGTTTSGCAARSARLAIPTPRTATRAKSTSTASKARRPGSSSTGSHLCRSPGARWRRLELPVRQAADGAHGTAEQRRHGRTVQRLARAELERVPARDAGLARTTVGRGQQGLRPSLVPRSARVQDDQLVERGRAHLPAVTWTDGPSVLFDARSSASDALPS
jgi:hypothetical protein